MEFFATAGGISVHISDTQKGENCLILLHGYLETMYIWNEFIDLISDDYRVIAIDLPGHGLSGSTQVNTMDFDAQTVKEGLPRRRPARHLGNARSRARGTSQEEACQDDQEGQAMSKKHNP